MTTYADLAKLACERKLYLPNIQRGVVWDEDDICALVDSILRGYPIGALFLWRTRLRDVVFRTFADSFNTTDFLPHLQTPTDQDEVSLVLDGQQRIQALLIGLRGRYNGKRCCVRVAAPREGVTDPDELAFDIEFLDETRLAAKQAEDAAWRPVQDVYYFPTRVIEDLVAGRPGDRQAIEDTVHALCHAFDTEAKIIEVGPEKSLREVVNIFIRVNRAGEPLRGADLIMALVKTGWATAGEMFDRLARELDYDVDSTFILRWALTYLGRSTDLRNIVSVADNAAVIQRDFADIARIARDTMTVIKDAVDGRRGIVGSAGLPLIPLLHFVRKGGQLDCDRNRARARYWLFWSHLIGRFSNRGSTKVAFADEAIDESEGPDLPIEEMIRKVHERYPHVQPRVDLREDSGILELAAMKQAAILRIYQRERIADAAVSASQHVDHIFPESKLEARPGIPSELVHDIGNLRLYLGILNERKNAQDPQAHIEGKSREELEREFGIDDRALFDYERFPEFVRLRRARIVDAVKAYLAYS